MNHTSIFRQNLKRAKEALAWEIPQKGRGKPPEIKYDLYRLALVYAFAALEQYLKHLETLKFPSEVNNKILTLRIVDDQYKPGPEMSIEMIDESELSSYKAKLLANKLRNHEKSTLTNPAALEETIKYLLTGSKPLDELLLKSLKSIAVRRNQIVHALDRDWKIYEKRNKNNNIRKVTQFRPRSLTEQKVVEFINQIEEAFVHLNKHFKNPTHKKKGRKKN